MLRMALYETAFLNMTVNTGTVALCMFNAKVRYINFVYISDEDYSGSERFHEAAGTPVGSQYPGASKYQKIVWGGGGDCKKIVMEFIDMADLIKSDLPN